MIRKTFFLIILLIVVAPMTSVRAEHPASIATKPSRVDTNVYSMIAEVNALRAANGLPGYSISPILMSTAQQHAEFMSVNGVSHIGYGGTRPSQRALNAGYPLAGDLSLGGFISENITAGNNKSVQQAVLEWQGDAPHLNTMLSPNLQEIGAGVAYVGDYVYYVIDCARPTGSGQPQAYTPVPGAPQGSSGNIVAPALARTVIPNTPNADGKLYHIVGPGETLWLIAISYGVKIADIRRLNYMTDTEAIYPGDKLLIRAGVTLTPSSATPSNTPQATFTFIPTLRQAPPPGTSQGNALRQVFGVSTQTNAQDTAWTPSPLPTATPALPAPVSSNSSMMVVGTIVLAALVLAGILVRAGRGAQ